MKNICFHPDQETSESVFERPDSSPQLQTPTHEPMGKIKYIYNCVVRLQNDCNNNL